MDRSQVVTAGVSRVRRTSSAARTLLAREGRAVEMELYGRDRSTRLPAGALERAIAEVEGGFIDLRARKP